MTRIKEIWRYPVKSMAGERLTETALSQRGVTGDRAWIIRDEVSGAICGAKAIGGLMRLSSAYTEPPTVDGSSAASIGFEDGTTASTSDENINKRLSAALNHDVTLWPLVPETQKEHYRRAVAINKMSETEVRALFARNSDEPLPEVSGFPVELMEYESPLGTYFDAFPLLVMTTRSLDSMQQRAPESNFDVRRFRPNILLEGTNSDNPFPEFDWVGKRAAVGDAIIQFALRCPRCVMVTRPFQDLPKDPKVMRALVRETNGDLGIGSIVEQPGSIRAGDTVTFLD